MKQENEEKLLRKRAAAVELAPEDFRTIGHRLVDQLADFLAGLPSRPVTPGETPREIRSAIASDRALPELGTDPASVATSAAELLFAHSLFNGHPRFFGYITSSASPIGALGDFSLASLTAMSARGNSLPRRRRSKRKRSAGSPSSSAIRPIAEGCW